MQALFRNMRANEEAPDWGVFTALALMVVVYLFMSIVGVTLGSVLFAQNLDAALIGGWLIGGLLGLAAIFFGQRGQLDGLRLRSGYPPLIAFGIGLGAAITLDLIAIPITGRVIEPPELGRVLVSGGALLWVVSGLFVVVVQPAVEEVLFRGVLFPALRAAQHVWAAVILSGLLYAFFHQLLYSYPNEVPLSWWYTFAEPLAIGLVLGVLRAATQSTGAALVAHVGVGVFALLKALLIAAVLTG